MKNKICSITVTYKPDFIINKQIKLLLKFIDKIIIIDNGSVNKKMLQKISRYKKIFIVYNEENIGLAAALNMGIKYAIKRGFKWVLALDQDSLPDKNMINKMIKVYNELSYDRKKDIGGIFPYHIELQNKNKLKITDNSYKFTETAITSGSMFKIDIFKKTGFFEEKLFIDYIDYEFCLRAKKFGYKFIMVNNAILYHKLGDTKEIYFLNKKRVVTNHSPLRRYYITRNRFYVYKKYFNIAKNFIINDFKCFIKEIIKIILFEKEKFSKLYMIFLGLIHFLFNRYGKLKGF